VSQNRQGSSKRQQVTIKSQLAGSVSRQLHRQHCQYDERVTLMLVAAAGHIAQTY